jgi:hypothetical protein
MAHESDARSSRWLPKSALPETNILLVVRVSCDAFTKSMPVAASVFAQVGLASDSEPRPWHALQKNAAVDGNPPPHSI